ncbi:hypothetical protein CCACVL1_17248 [Corchorus capsularis]|uniref:Uncharacterized protein n=1 Tax=Corchorus capsularis TaxID=210143 RepID=A0A1R3HT78_COCAP|nr:hypothetical protein CCACVL1_17248 [Corchorus capsularis]
MGIASSKTHCKPPQTFETRTSIIISDPPNPSMNLSDF